MRGFLHRLRALLLRGKLERELQEELAFHRAVAAERGDQRRFGNELRLREKAREAWMFRRLEELRQDISVAWRGLRRAPGFVFAVVATLALGIGADSAIFSLAYGVLWKPLPYPDASRIVEIRQGRGAWYNMQNSAFDISQARGRNVGFSALAMYRGDQETLTGAGGPITLSGAEVEADTLRIVGTKPVLGRLLERSDDHQSASPVVVISVRLWQTRFGGRRNIIGKSIELDGKPWTVVGVAALNFPPAFDVTETLADNAYWRPWQEDPEGPGDRDVSAIARLAPGITAAQAQARLNLEMDRLANAHSEDKGWRFSVTPMRTFIVRDAAPALWMMLAVVGLTLLIAAANVACLLLARGQQREPELATRAALGASRGRIVRQLATESAILVAAGAGVGLASATAAIAWLRANAPSDLPRLGNVSMNWTVVGFTAVVAVIVTLLCGLGPALSASGRRLEPNLRPAPGAAGRRANRSRGAWVVAQVAISLLLLVGAGLLLTGLRKILAVPLGFDPGRVLSFELDLPPASYPTSAARLQLITAVAGRLAALPGVTHAAAASFLPLAGMASTGYSLPGHPLRPNDDSQSVVFNPVTADYFETLHLPLLAGRSFSAADNANAPPIALISESMARTTFEGHNPIGQRIQFSWGKEPWRTIVGVVADAKDDFGDKPAPVPPTAYVPLAQRLNWEPPGLAFVARTTAADPLSLAGAARHAVGAIDASLPLVYVHPLSYFYASDIAEPRFRSYVVSGFAALALLLTAVGIYGVLAYGVSTRSREFGVRTALGARPRQVLAMVLRQALVLLALGLALGLGAALLLTRYLADLIYGVSPTDPWVLGGTALLLAAVGLAAAFGPGRKAMRADPAQALRCE